MKKKAGIITDCLCDLPKSILERYHIETVYFLVRTDKGIFMDTEEITAENIFQYVQEQGKIPISREPSPDVFKDKFEKELEKYEEIIYVAIGSGVSKAYESAGRAIADMGEMGKRVHVFDTGHLSTGEGHMVIHSAELAEKGADASEILDSLNQLKKRVVTSFIVETADFLYSNGKLSQNIKRLCDILSVHPVLVMKDGKLVLQTILFGNYGKACMKYVRMVLKHPQTIDGKRIFITHAGCMAKNIQQVKDEVERGCNCKEVVVTNASATVSSNCGPNTFGILYVRRQ